jgi:hypothetical protein
MIQRRLPPDLLQASTAPGAPRTAVLSRSAHNVHMYQLHSFAAVASETLPIASRHSVRSETVTTQRCCTPSNPAIRGQHTLHRQGPLRSARLATVVDPASWRERAVCRVPVVPLQAVAEFVFVLHLATLTRRAGCGTALSRRHTGVQLVRVILPMI